MPAVISASSMPEPMRQLMEVCFKMFIRLLTRKKLSGRVMANTTNRMASTSSGPNFIKISPRPTFFFACVMRSLLPTPLS